ncbi:MAG: hypothetical protein ACRDJC_23635, partial [Thermomicrobiales bacterium]
GMTVGTAGLAAVAHAFTAEAKKKGKKDKSDKKAKKQCNKQLAACTAQATQRAAQVEQCTTFFTDSCAGEADCTDQIACCAVLGSCDVNAFFACLVTAGA